MDKNIIFSIRPKFIPKIVGVQLVVIGVSSAFTIAIVVQILLTILSAILGWSLNIEGLFGIVFLISLIGVPVFLYEIRRKNQSLTRFDFYDEYLDFSYFTGVFMNRKQGRLHYRDITDMIQYSNFYQNFAQLKTIQLHAPSTSLYQQGQNFIGIQLQDIKSGIGYGGRIQSLLEGNYNNTVEEYIQPESSIELEVKEKSGTK